MMDWIAQAFDVATLLVGVGLGYLLGRRIHYPFPTVTDSSGSDTSPTIDLTVPPLSVAAPTVGLIDGCQCGVPGVRCPVHGG